MSYVARGGYIDRRYIFYPSIQCSVGQLTLPFLSQAQGTATQPTLHVLSSTTFDTLHTLNECPLERTISLRSVPRTVHLLIMHIVIMIMHYFCDGKPGTKAHLPLKMYDHNA